MAVTITLGSVESMAPAMIATVDQAAAGPIEIPCGFMPSRMTIILDGASDMLLEYIEGLTGYLKLVTGAVTIETDVLITETDAGFLIDGSLEGAGDYYVAAWR